MRDMLIVIIGIVLIVVVYFDTKALKKLVEVIQKQTVTIEKLNSTEQSFFNNIYAEINPIVEDNKCPSTNTDAIIAESSKD